MDIFWRNLFEFSVLFYLYRCTIPVSLHTVTIEWFLSVLRIFSSNCNSCNKFCHYFSLGFLEQLLDDNSKHGLCRCKYKNVVGLIVHRPVEYTSHLHYSLDFKNRFAIQMIFKLKCLHKILIKIYLFSLLITVIQRSLLLCITGLKNIDL